MPSKEKIPVGGVSHKDTAIGGWDSSKVSVKSLAIF
jgi:hypothetical protein